MTPPHSKTADYIIVGAGSAGAVLANRLSRSARVSLIEAGPADHAWDFRLHMPAALSHVLKNDTYNWYYHTEPEPHLDHRRIYCPRGRVLGGSSSINGMIFVRGNPCDYDAWARVPGLSEWSYEACLPYFKRSERCGVGEDAYRGRSGAVAIGQGNTDDPLNQAWLEATGEAGFRRSDDFNGAMQEGAGIFDASIYQGARMSTARAYLKPVQGESNLSVIDRALTHRVIFNGSRATGIEYVRRGRLEQIHTDGEVILCAGAINSPQLLMLSGIGDGAQLGHHGIPVVSHLPGVGKGLKDHLEVYLQFSCRQPVSIYPAMAPWRQPFIGLQWYLTRSGPGATNHFHSGAFLRSGLDSGYPDLQFHFLPIAMNYDGSEYFKGHGFQLHVGPMKPTSEGSVTLRNNDPHTPPVIRFNYHETEEDRQVMIRGVKIGREIVSQPAFRDLRGAELGAGSDTDAMIRRRAESAYHPACTCAMGSHDNAVVDGAARVYGTRGLRVIDASIMPDIINANLNATVIMMAEKLGQTIIDGDSP